MVLGDGELDSQWDIAVDTSGNVYVADTINDRIQKFSNEGHILLQNGVPVAMQMGNLTDLKELL